MVDFYQVTAQNLVEQGSLSCLVMELVYLISKDRLVTVKNHQLDQPPLSVLPNLVLTFGFDGY